MHKKYPILIIIVIIFIGLGILEYTDGTISGLMFNEMKYNYDGIVLIPANEANGSSLGGYYTVNGTGHNFNILILLTGGANDTSDPLDYTSNGLHITGHIDTIKVTPQTIISLYQNNFKEAIFSTIFNGSMSMKCSVWNGTSNFQSNGHQLTGTFQINGSLSDWRGKYTMTDTHNSIYLVGDYINYSPLGVQYIHKDYYL